VVDVAARGERGEGGEGGEGERKREASSGADQEVTSTSILRSLRGAAA
jgi:hypothetical protein